MADIVVGVLALVVGLFLCFRGRGALRVLLTVWGGFAGFGLGATIVARVTETGPLDTTAGWIGAIVGALVVASLTHVFFAVAVVLAFTSMGFVIGQSLAGALGVSDPWTVVGVGVLGGLVLGLLAALTDMPDLVLVVIGALAGASVAVRGVMLLLDAADLGHLAESRLRVADQPVWFLAQIALAVIGIVVQLRSGRSRTVRRSWQGR